MSEEAKFTQADVDNMIATRLAKVKQQRDDWKAKHAELQGQFDEKAAEVVSLGKQVQTFQAASKHTEGLQQQLAQANARWDAAQAVSALGLGVADTASMQALYSAAPAPAEGDKPAFGDWLKAEAANEGSFVSRVLGAKPAAKAEEAKPPPGAEQTKPKALAPDATKGREKVNGAAGMAIDLAAMSPADIVRLSSENPAEYMRAIGLTLPGASG